MGFDHGDAASFEATRRTDPATTTRLRNLWGRAEQAATDYGVRKSIAMGRWPTFQEWAGKSVTDTWRFAVANGDGIANSLDNYWCRMIAICRAVPDLYHVVRDPLINPKADPSTIRYIFDAMWVTLGKVTCRYVDYPFWKREIRLC